ncbi:Single-stranded DNA-binding protein ssb [compost metagenome]
MAVEGRIQVRNYENNEGKKVYVTEVIADNVRFLESNRDQKATGSSKDHFTDHGSPIEFNDSDLPF